MAVSKKLILELFKNLTVDMPSSLLEFRKMSFEQTTKQRKTLQSMVFNTSQGISLGYHNILSCCLYPSDPL